MNRRNPDYLNPKLLKKLLLVALLLGVVTTGCGIKRTGVSGDNSQNKQGEQYSIYYLNAQATKLLPLEYETETKDPDQLIAELMIQFRTVPKNVDASLALGEKVEYDHAERIDNVVYLYFDSNYGSMKADREILCRAALAKTMTQIEGVNYVSIYTGDQPLMDASGMPVGPVADTDFIENISDVNAYEKMELTLYFTDIAGEKLYPEKREVIYNINSALERMVVEELVAGPKQPGLAPTLEKNCKLLNVSVNDSVCYLNFDNSFLTSTLNVKDYIPIYSIVNSLSELATVNRVQITVNGSQDVSFRDTIPLNTLLERNLDYMEVP